jgi:signal transduction histidine kinase/DNA-binding NarL/FixJ family response regulator
VQGRKLLLIETNEKDLDLCLALFSSYKNEHQLFSATSLGSGVALASECNPDCILLGNLAHKSPALETLSELLVLSPYTPVVLLGDSGDDLSAIESIKKGAEDYLRKSDLTATLIEKTISVAIYKKSLEKQLHEKEQALQRKQIELNEAVNFNSLIQKNMPGYVFVKDAEFRIVEANSRFMSLYPKEMQDKVIGFTTFEQYDEQEKEAFLEMDRKAFETGVSEVLEKITFPNGEVRSLHTLKTRFYNAEGDAFILGTSTDVTERESLISQLKKSNKDLEQFAYIASHDLKSPLNAIKKLVTWIEEDFSDDMPKGALAHLGLIKDRSARLAHLLTDLLDYSRLNSKLGEYDHFEFEPLVRACHAMNDDAENFILDVSNIAVLLPKTALHIVFLNLISNSIKHHDKASGSISISIHKQKSGYIIDYEDDGPGIAPDFSEKIFEMFQTLKPRDEVEGSGMGLAIVRKTIEHYGGSISLIFPPKSSKGAHFRIFWPNTQLQKDEY